ncbi:MAG TPA: hypothetical protein VJ739_11380 [Gemmataceae bacterium]|nr:hypothetical protein [Gemmataceae bacterium]
MTKANRPKFELITIPKLVGAHREVHVTLLGTPFLRSPQTGVIKPVEKLRREDGSYFDGDFSLFILIRVMFQCGTYTIKMKEHLPRLLHQCFDCRKELLGELRKPHRFEFDVGQSDIPTFQVRIEAAAVKCPGCGRDAILWTDEVAAEIGAAVREALSSRENVPVRDAPVDQPCD